MLMASVAAPSLPFDDSYISFAYAAHLVDGSGLRLSVGSAPVEAFSDPLWVVLMAAGKAIGFGLVTCSLPRWWPWSPLFPTRPPAARTSASRRPSGPSRASSAGHRADRQPAQELGGGQDPAGSTTNTGI